MVTTNFFTAVDRRYELFVPMFAYSVLANNPDAIVEIAVEDPERIRREHEYPQILNEAYPDRFILRSGDFEKAHPAAVRFLEEPRHRLEHTYIGDADIIVLDHVSPWHIQKMKELDLPHSNVIRPNSQRLTGLHFCKTDFHYPIGNLHHKGYGKGCLPDEQFLYHIYETKDALPPRGHQLRPQHGIHLSLSRVPYGRPSWGILEKYVQPFTELFAGSLWRDIATHCDRRSTWIVDFLHLAVEAQEIFPEEDVARMRILSDAHR